MTRPILKLTLLFALAANNAFASDTPAAFKENWNAVSLEAEALTGTQVFDSNMYGVRAGYGQYFMDNLGFWLEAEIMHFQYAGEHQGRTSVTGIGLTPLLRWHAWEHGSVSVFGDLGLGIALTESRYPIFGENDRGTYLNTTPQLAVGATWQFSENYMLKAGWRYYHLSNGDVYGAERNPGHDSDGYFLGVVLP